jgi:hypothetical protein
LITADQKKNLKRGKAIQLSIRMLGALSTEYSVDSQSYDESGFKPVNNFFWNVKLTTNASGDIKAELLKLEASNL